MTYVHPDLSACRSGRSRPKYWGGPYLPSLLFPLEVSPLNTATWSGERCKHPQRGLGRKSNLVHFSVISDIFGGIKFTIFSDNQLTTVYQRVRLNLGCLATIRRGSAPPPAPAWNRHWYGTVSNRRTASYIGLYPVAPNRPAVLCIDVCSTLPIQNTLTHDI